MIDYSEIKGLDQDLKKVNEHIRRLCKTNSPFAYPIVFPFEPEKSRRKRNSSGHRNLSYGITDS